MSGSGSYQGELEGQLDGSGLQVALVVARFHSDLTGRMCDAAVETLVQIRCATAKAFCKLSPPTVSNTTSKPRPSVHVSMMSSSDFSR